MHFFSYFHRAQIKYGFSWNRVIWLCGYLCFRTIAIWVNFHSVDLRKLQTKDRASEKKLFIYVGYFYMRVSRRNLWGSFYEACHPRFACMAYMAWTNLIGQHAQCCQQNFRFSSSALKEGILGFLSSHILLLYWYMCRYKLASVQVQHRNSEKRSLFLIVCILTTHKVLCCFKLHMKQFEYINSFQQPDILHFLRYITMFVVLKFCFNNHIRKYSHGKVYNLAKFGSDWETKKKNHRRPHKWTFVSSGWEIILS